MPRLKVGSHWMRCVATRCGAVRNRCVTLRHFRRNVLQYAASCRMRLQDVRQRRAQCAARARHRIAMAWTYLWTFIYHHCTGQFFAFFLAERGNVSVDPTDYVRLLNMRHSSLWSADENTLLVPRTSLKFGEPAFSVAGPAAWNSLPADIRTTSSNTAFKKRLKTFLFINVYDVTDY